MYYVSKIFFNLCKILNSCPKRLDFENLNLQQPDGTDHVCTTDQFIVSGGAPIPSICGTNSGTHGEHIDCASCVTYISLTVSAFSAIVYVDLGTSSTQSAVLSAVTSGSSFARSFSVKVTQVECNALNRGDNNAKT